jgi:amino acid transporter
MEKLPVRIVREHQRERDTHQLRRLGYVQQLLREMGGFSNFALSFSVISILTGAVTLYGYGLQQGGPLVMSLGWPLVAVMTLPVAMSLAQLASAYPTAGALYHWSSIFGGTGWGFFTAWFNTIGQVAITAGVDYGLALFLAPMLGLPADRAHLLGLYAAILLSHAAFNHFGVRAVAVLNSVSAWYHLIGVVALVTVLSSFAPLQPAKFLLRPFSLQGQPYIYGFLVGLLQAQWTFTGFDASAHVTEETIDPTRNAPWGIVLSVAISGLAGYALLVAVTMAIVDLPATAQAANPFIHVLRLALGERLGGALVWLVIGAMWFCGLSSLTSNSRMLFAFARDGGLPRSQYLARVSPRFLSPHWAIWVCAGGALAIGLWTPVYSAMVALSTLALYASYALPIGLGLWARSSGRWRARGPWDLGRWSGWVNATALGWVAIITVLFVLPPNQLAGYTFVGCVVLLGSYWFGYMRARFRGPPLGAERANGESAPS